MNNYSQQLQQLQPPGMALPSDPDSAWVALLDGIAAEFARIDGRTQQLETEITLSDGTVELLAEWERVLGLPDDCMAIPADPADRLAVIRSRIAAAGGQTPQYLIGLIETLGVSATIVEEEPFEMGRHGMGDPIGGSEWRHVWRYVTADDVPAELRDVIRCTVDRHKPAHTVATAEYRLDTVGPSSSTFHELMNTGLPAAVGSLK